MQSVKVFARGNSVRATLTDASNNPNSTSPTLPLYSNTEIALTLFKGDGDEKYSKQELSQYGFMFFCDDDYNAVTEPKIGTTSGITVDNSGTIHIPISTATEEVTEWISASESKVLHAELQGFEQGETNASFLIQFDLTLRNRVFYTGSFTPSPISALYYTKAESDARFAPISLVARVSALETVDGILDTLLG